MNTRLIQHIKKFFEEKSLHYALVGGFALHAYGYTRATKDIDFVTDVSNHKIISQMLEELGFHSLQNDTSFAIFINDLSKDRIDFMYVDVTTSKALFSNTQMKFIDEIELPVVSPTHLAMMKIFAASQDTTRCKRDIEDVHQLYLRDVIDADSIKEILTKYDLLNYFEDITSFKE